MKLPARRIRYGTRLRRNGRGNDLGGSLRFHASCLRQVVEVIEKATDAFVVKSVSESAVKFHLRGCRGS